MYYYDRWKEEVIVGHLIHVRIEQPAAAQGRPQSNDQPARGLRRAYPCPQAAIFTWNPHCLSHKLTLDDDHLVCTSKEGSGFKTVTGTEVFV